MAEWPVPEDHTNAGLGRLLQKAIASLVLWGENSVTYFTPPVFAGYHILTVWLLSPLE
jgi:hypothetical protein